jgi:hypothetical protein
VNFGTPVVGAAFIVLAVEEHAGERRDAQSFDGLARIQRRIDVHDEVPPGEI